MVPAEESGIGPRVPGNLLWTPEADQRQYEGRDCNHAGAKEGLAYLPPEWNLGPLTPESLTTKLRLEVRSPWSTGGVNLEPCTSSPTHRGQVTFLLWARIFLIRKIRVQDLSPKSGSQDS